MRKDFLVPAATLSAAIINARQESEGAPSTEEAVELYMEVLNSLHEAYRNRNSSRPDR